MISVGETKGREERRPIYVKGKKRLDRVVSKHRSTVLALSFL